MKRRFKYFCFLRSGVKSPSYGSTQCDVALMKFHIDRFRSHGVFTFCADDEVGLTITFEI